MSIKSRILVTAVALSAVAIAAPAQAAIVVENYTFAATTGNTIVSNESGSFSLSYDNALPFAPVLTAINYSIGSTVFNLGNAAAQAFSGGFLIYGTQNATSIFSGTDDFFLGNYVGDFLAFTRQSSPGEVGSAGNIYNVGSASITLVNGAVPEPAAWAMLIAGFGLVGGTMRRRLEKRAATLSLA
jgi:PEP-CTERM motif